MKKQAKSKHQSTDRVRRFFANLGPGLITGAADDDPSGISTEAAAWRGTLEDQPGLSRKFYALIAVAMLLGLALDFVEEVRRALVAIGAL
jgi:hypothetical protein